MLHYTDALSLLMRDIAHRVPDLSHVPMDRVLVFARPGRAGASGPNASCHALGLTPTEPGYFFWTDSDTGVMTRRTPWFVTRWPEVSWHGQTMAYLISVNLPRFAEQPSASKRQRYFDLPSWVCRLDTIVHEMFHVAPEAHGLREMRFPDGRLDDRSHPPAFFDAVELLVREYLGTEPDPSVLAVVRDDLGTLVARHGRVLATTFRRYPSYPRRFVEVLADQPDGPAVPLEPLPSSRRPSRFTEDDIVARDITAMVLSRARHAA